MKRLIKDMLMRRHFSELAKSRSERIIAVTRERQEEDRERLAARAKRRGPIPRIFH